MVFLKLLLIGGLVAFTIYEIVSVVKTIRDNKKVKTQKVETEDKKAK